MQESEISTRVISVGIMSEKDIEIVLHGNYRLENDIVTGAVSLSAKNVKEKLVFVPVDPDCAAEVKDVTIGVNFHWQRKENQLFRGTITILPHDGELILVNTLSVEDYLASVISSEMSATSMIELLKAHAVISRSWVLAQIENKAGHQSQQGIETETRRVRWYGHDDHDLFDVCADDHCQRYQGITRQTTKLAQEAVDATRGEVLLCEGRLCDTRFSKCCGGVFEQFEYCWEDQHYPYLVARRDGVDPMDFPDLRIEEEAVRWIKSSPKAFCNTQDKAVLAQVLNGYDQETADFYRWTVEYTTDELSELIARRSGIDFGRIIDLVPVERGTSGRISLLKVVGEKRTMEIGKELEIRRILSESHLYSSAFVVEKTPDGFRLIGAGWGHGVGLCQIGAAMMAHKGYGYREILLHYYPGSEIVTV